MIWDYFVWLSDCDRLDEMIPVGSLCGGFVDQVSKSFLEAEIERLEAEEVNDRDRRRQADDKKTQLRGEYMTKVSCAFPDKFYPEFHVDFSVLPSDRWLGLQLEFELLTPWYSRDDRVLHVMDNPVRKDRVFGVPFMAASSWKGMLRWAFQMQMKLIGPEKEEHEEKRKQARAWELHLFGNEKNEEKNFHQGALIFYPTWFDRIGFEVINPHSRERRAGTQPIYYEVVCPGSKGILSLLYAPWPGMKPEVDPSEVFPKLLEAIEALLTTYGISAKRTVGWGTAKILKWRAFHRENKSIEKAKRKDFEKEIKNWIT